MPGALDVARALEEGRLRDRGGALGRALAGVWGRVAAARIVRPLPRPSHVRLVAIGGATLGGSGKTPLAIACARWLALAGTRVALVGHAYRAAPGRARLVKREDPIDEVGDEALLAALELEAHGVPVIVGRTRREAVALASTLADVVVIDGVLQTRPRAALALLAVDATHPWGRAQAVPPRGDLRAPVAALVAAADRTVRVGEAVDGPCDARTASRGAWVGGELRTWDALRSLRVGLVVALARPERVLASLARRGLVPTAVVRSPDHGPVSPRDLLRAPPVDLWLATPKCALHARLALDPARPGGRSPAAPPGQVLAVLEHTVALGADVTQQLARLDPANPGQ